MMSRCLIISATIVVFMAVSANSSAIPMWEFLSRDEKMSHLYRVYSKQVARYCSDSTMPDCTKNLLVSGLRNLANMNEDYLDKLDPYQRGAKEIIWRAMMRNNGAEDSYYTTGADPLAASYGSDRNDLAEESAPVGDYVRPAGHTGPYLVGPMVIRVLPDGRPVPGDAKRPLPRDEDVDDLKYSRIPSIAEVEASSKSFFYGKSNPSKHSRILFSGGKGQRPSLIETRTTHQQSNPLFDERRAVSELSSNARSIRFF